MRVPLSILAALVLLPSMAQAEEHWVVAPGAPGMAGPGTYGLGIWALAEYRGEIIACGEFTSAGGQACNRIAAWNGVGWRSLGAGLNDLGVCLAVHDTSLYVGGFFTEAGGVPGTSYIARWDGQTWHPVGGGMNGRVYGLGVFGSELVVGGPFTAAGQTLANYVARWDGAEWHAMGAGFTEGDPLPTVWCFAEYGGQLIAGGRFSRSGSTVVNRVARWDGVAWQPLGDGVGPSSVLPTVHAMAVLGGSLIVGGTFQTAGSIQAENLARWDGSQWHAMTSSGFEGDNWNEVAAVYPYGTGLVVGGRFNSMVGVAGSSHLAVWDGQSWGSLGNGTNGLVDDFIAYGSGLFVAGQFTMADTFSANCAALWTETAPWLLIVDDEPSDQGGFLHALWNAHEDDAVGASPQVTEYELQRDSESWTMIELIEAAQADSYVVVFETPDILTPGEPAPTAAYRVIARTTDPLVSYISPVVESYSIDNLPPLAPALELFDSEEYRYVNWQNSADPDFEETCLFRGSEPGFEAGDPLLCEATQVWYQEYDLHRYWYRARSFDIHGNASEWSNEVVGRYPTGVPGTPSTLRLYPNQPNPFNPLTTLRFDVPVGGRVRLEVFDVAGRLVRTLLDVELPVGSHSAVWDGKDERGMGVASGSYFARLSAGGRVEAVRMGLVR